MTAQPVLATFLKGFPSPHAFLESAETLLDYAFQPIVDAHSGDSYGYEALLRNVGQMGFQTPVEVFDFAEDAGVLVELECLLRKKAVTKFVSLPNRGKAKLFLNVDARLLETDGYLYEETGLLLDGVNLAASQIVLEVCEAGEIGDNGRLAEFTKLGRDLGFGFAIDDYGRGYSQLKSLYDIEPDILKIDRFFVQTINSDARKKLMVRTVVDVAHVLGMRVVAEGVETAQELATCKDIGCDLIQGYLVARPFQDLEEAEARYPVVSSAAKRPVLAPRDDMELVNREIKPLVPLQDRARMEEVLNLLRAGRANPFIPVINASGEPRGLIREKDIKTFVYMPFGRDLLLNPVMSNSLGAFTHRCPIANFNTPLDQLVEMVADEDDEAGGIIITRNGKYCGFLTTTSLLKISNEVRMRAAENQNPLTKMPGNASIIQYVQNDAQSPEVERSFCYLDFDNFKPFNDAYGFTVGDRALLLFSELLKRLATSEDVFAGHIGGDDFFIGARGRTTADMKNMIGDLQDAFRHQAESLYDPSDRLKGYIEAQDRHGVARKFPLLRCSAAILHLPVGLSVDRKDILGRQIASLKSEAKGCESGIAEATLGQLVSPSVL
ncbi:GGDEF domain-containing protein [Labrenzia sp. PHM005]|uniref:GGDEF domain-containing protein n=1 Tax=Labrenzia sp. PHM005 TaxID=2590016 RepID=UPI00113FF7DD|nr:GGDEF domain-containing protein [Labrenzia sp. PHM005]QDG75561.1 EAL domain-containing protein [Labrenzia sp. PHM005]